MLNTARLNTATFNGTGSSSASLVLGGVAPRAVIKYTLEVRSKTGAMKSPLPAYYGGEFTERRNQAHELRFRYDATLGAAAYLTTANQVWLRDDTGNLLQRFHIRSVKPAHDGPRAEVEVTGLSILSQLSNEWIQDYAATDTIGNHLAAWLSAQVGSLPIHLGYISPAYKNQSFTFEYDASRIRNAFNDMYDAVGEGDFWVDPLSRRLNWKTRSGDNKGQRIRYGLNARGITKTEDDSELYTRLYLYGAGNGADKLTLLDAGEAHKYIQQNTGTYGIIPNVVTMTDIKDADTLLAVANALIARYSSPVISYEVDVIDYSNSNDGPDFSFERLRIGSTVKVIDDTLGIEVMCKVVEIAHNLDNPLDIKVTLDNKPKDLRFIIADLLNRVETIENASIEMSDATPQPVGTASPGTSDGLSRDDHAHAIDEDALADLINDPDSPIHDAVETVGSAAISPGSPILSIGTANADGSSADYARVDHVHKGSHFSATDAASLPSEAEGSDGVTTGSNKRGYTRVNSAWVCLTHIE